MSKKVTTILLSAFLMFGCSNIPSSEDINSDLKTIEKEITDAQNTVEKYSGGLLAILANVRLQTLKTTKSILEQKKDGFRRYIPLSYSIDGKEYTPPENKDIILQGLDNDLKELQRDLSKAEEESAKYGGGLLGILSFTQVATIKNSIAFLNQKRLLLKYDIPFYDILPDLHDTKDSGFSKTPGDDIDKF